MAVVSVFGLVGAWGRALVEERDIESARVLVGGYHRNNWRGSRLGLSNPRPRRGLGECQRG
jgi:hypothetical protein